MLKNVLAVVSLSLSLNAQAWAEPKSWNVAEEGTSGIQYAQGAWDLNVEGEKISGNAVMTTNRGEPLSYKVDGSVKDAVYTVTLSDRSDGKKGCVWSGHNSKTWHGLAGAAHCDGNVGLIIRASSQ